MRIPLLSNSATIHFLTLALLFTIHCGRSQAQDPLPSWEEGKAKARIVEFVKRVTTEDSQDFVPASERFAVFDNDGTLWSEQPVYFQAAWALDRLKELAKDHPEWKDSPPFQAAIAGDIATLMKFDKDEILKVLLTAHSDVTAEEFNDSISKWLDEAKNPATGKRYIDMVYQPMLELMDYLRANDFRVCIVSGGGIDFLRVFSEDRYGIPPELVIGTTLEARFEMRDGIPTIVKEGGISLIDDKAGKPVGIFRHLGRRPLIAVGNSDGDLQMLQYTTIPRNAEDKTPRLGILVHHTDGEREFKYDRDSHIGQLDKALDEAPQRDWLIIDMQEDWNTVFPK